jgi:hypothetical protein
MDKITNSLINTFVKQFEIDALDLSKKFEHFCNFSIITKNYRGTFELGDIHTGSGGDCAIDGLCIIANGQIITDEDELKELVENSGYLDADIYFIQSKSSSSFDGALIGSFIHGVKDFLSDSPKLVQNEKIKKMKSIWEYMITMSSYMHNRRPNCKMYFATTGKWVQDQNLCAIIDSGTKELDTIGIFEKIIIEALGALGIQKLYHETKNKLSTTVKFQNRITLPDINGISEAYLGIIPLAEFLSLIQDENRTINSIFDDNVRDFQGQNTVNEKIKDTLEQAKYDLFCVLNNGITVVAASLTPAGDRFTIRDYQVVNGCQTSHVLHKCQDFEGIENVNVPIKIIVTNDDDIKTSITLATNSQTEVKTEQLEALSAFQRKLELYYKAETTAYPLYYERRSQQYNADVSVKKTQIISIPIQIKCFASMFLNSPHLVAAYYGTIVKRFRNNIFSEDHIISSYYVSALCYYRIEQFFRSGDIEVSYKKARFHILLLVRLLAMGENLDPFNSRKFEKSCDKLKGQLLDDTTALDLFKTATKIFLESPLDKTKSRYKSESETELLIREFQIKFTI